MNDLPLSDDDLSADLDGLADPGVAARIAADPGALDRRAALAGAAERLGTTPVAPLGDAQVDALIHRALEEPVAPAPPARRPGRATPWLVAAVVIALVAVGLGLVWSGRQASTSDQASTGADAAEESGSSAAGADATLDEDALDGVADEAPRASTTVPATTLIPQTGAATSSAPIIDLGTFADADALRAALADAMVPATADANASSEFDAPSPEAVERCAGQLQITLDLAADPLAVGSAVVDGRAVLVYEWDHRSFEDGSPTTLVTAVGRDACDEVTLFER